LSVVAIQECHARECAPDDPVCNCPDRDTDCGAGDIRCEYRCGIASGRGHKLRCTPYINTVNPGSYWACKPCVDGCKSSLASEVGGCIRANGARCNAARGLTTQKAINACLLEPSDVCDKKFEDCVTNPASDLNCNTKGVFWGWNDKKQAYEAKKAEVEASRATTLAERQARAAKQNLEANRAIELLKKDPSTYTNEEKEIVRKFQEEGGIVAVQKELGKERSKADLLIASTKALSEAQKAAAAAQEAASAATAESEKLEATAMAAETLVPKEPEAALNPANAANISKASAAREAAEKAKIVALMKAEEAKNADLVLKQSKKHFEDASKEDGDASNAAPTDAAATEEPPSGDSNDTQD
jgi:hypothetical protein